jgi:hypothetical protein
MKSRVMSWQTAEKMLLIGTLLAFGIVGFILYMLVSHLIAVVDAHSRFQSTQGIVVTSTVHVDRSPRRRAPRAHYVYRPDITFRYSVDSKEYVSSRYGLSVFSSSDRYVAEAAVDRFPPGQGVEVYFDPDHPEEGVLFKDIDPAYYPFMAVVAIFAWFCGLLTWALASGDSARAIHRFADGRTAFPCRIPMWGRVRVQHDVLSVKWTPSLWMAFFVGTVAASVVFAVLFVVFRDPLHSPNPVAFHAGLFSPAGVGVVSALIVSARRTRTFMLRKGSEVRLIARNSSRKEPWSALVGWTIREVSGEVTLADEATPGVHLRLELKLKRTEVLTIHDFRGPKILRSVAQKAASLMSHFSGLPLVESGRTAKCDPAATEDRGRRAL